MAVLKDLIVHGASKFLNEAYFNTISAESIGASEGVFNKIVATTGKIDSLSTEDLTANNATVLSLLDVRGELHTNQWTNSNIATIEGSFYITPTIGIPEGTMTTTANSVTVNGSNFPISSLYVNGINSDNTASTVAWTSDSKVLVTGEILVNGVYMPLGTLIGILDGDASATQIKIKSITDNRYKTASSLAEIGTQSTALPCRNVKVSMYQTYRDSALRPLGIFMTALGENGKTFLDIYGGGYATSTAVAGGFAKPVLRIGNLAGLPAVGGKTPVGYGIYTSNGYFSGTIVSTSGQIGNFTINSALYSNGHSAWDSSGNGIYINNDGISGGPGGRWWLWQDGSAKIGAMTLSAAGVLSVPAANITGTLTATQISVSTLSAISANMGTLTAGTISYGTVGNNESFYLSNINKTATIAGASRTNLRLSVGSGFGVDKEGKLYATGAVISGALTATSLTINSGAAVKGIQAGGRNLLLNTTVSTSNISKIRANTSYTSVVTEDGIICYKITGSNTAHLFNGTDVWDCMAEKLKANTTYTYSAWIKSSKGGTLSHTFLGHYNVSNSASTASDKTHEDTNRIYYPETIVANTWTKISVTFTTNSLAGSSFGVYPVYNTGSDTILYIYGFMLEEGNIASNWTPAPEDIDVHQYITDINSKDGIIIKAINGTTTANTSTSNYLRLNSTNGLEFYKAGVLAASYGGSTAQIGYASGKNIVLDSEGVKIRNGNSNTSTLALYGSTTKFYEPGTSTVAAEIGSDGLSITNGTINIGNGKFQVNTDGSLTSTSGQIGGWIIDGNILRRTVSSTETIDNESISGGTDSDGSSSDSSTNVTITSTVTLDDNGIIFNGTYNGNTVKTSVQPTGIYSNSFYRTSGYSIYQAFNLTGVNLYCFGNNKEILRFASKATAVSPSSKQGLSFMIGNGYYTVGSGDNHEVKSENLNMYLCGGTDETSKFIRSYPTYKRVYSGSQYTANMYVTNAGTFGRATSSSIRYKHDVEYITNENKSVIDDNKKILKKTKDDSNIYSVLDIPLVNFKYNKGYVSGEKDFDYEKSIFGVIADDIASICPECATYIKDENGNSIPESYNINQITFRMLYVIQQQEKRIKELENIIIKLEEK